MKDKLSRANVLHSLKPPVRSGCYGRFGGGAGEGGDGWRGGEGVPGRGGGKGSEEKEGWEGGKEGEGMKARGIGEGGGGREGGREPQGSSGILVGVLDGVPSASSPSASSERVPLPACDPYYSANQH